MTKTTDLLEWAIHTADIRQRDDDENRRYLHSEWVLSLKAVIITVIMDSTLQG